MTLARDAAPMAPLAAMNPMARLARLARHCAAALALAAGLVGCGYKSGLTLGPTHRTVGIEVFANASRERLVPDLERDLHRAMTEALIELVHATVVDPAEADLVVRGSVRDFRRRPGIRDGRNRLLETGIRIAVDAELFERAGDGSETAIGRSDQASRSGYVLDEPGAERDATDRVLQIVAQRVVLDLFAPLAY